MVDKDVVRAGWRMTMLAGMRAASRCTSGRIRQHSHFHRVSGRALPFSSEISWPVPRHGVSSVRTSGAGFRRAGGLASQRHPAACSAESTARIASETGVRPRQASCPSKDQRLECQRRPPIARRYRGRRREAKIGKIGECSFNVHLTPSGVSRSSLHRRVGGFEQPAHVG